MRKPKTQTKRFVRMLQGALLGLGAPLGWAFLANMTGCPPGNCPLLLYCYMTVGTSAAFAAFGFFLGSQEEKLSAMLILDPLTGLFNRRYFQSRINAEFANLSRYGAPLCLLILDLDRFKNVNDTFGHQAGDAVLVRTAAITEKIAREGDTVARVGGEEFAVLLHGTDSGGGQAVAERIRKAIETARMPIPGGRHVEITVSVGLAGTDLIPAKSPDELFAHADRALYTAKKSGRNIVITAPPPAPSKSDPEDEAPPDSDSFPDDSE